VQRVGFPFAEIRVVSLPPLPCSRWRRDSRSASIHGEANPCNEAGQILATGRPSAVSMRPELDSSADRPLLLELPAHASLRPLMRTPCAGGPDGGLPTSPAGGGAQGRQNISLSRRRTCRRGALRRHRHHEGGDGGGMRHPRRGQLRPATT
jgi:hypothetical protein